MLQSLYIQNVVLIDKLHLTFCEGLCVLTGETGAGKSILLDALSLALGERAQSSFIRPGCTQATVAAVFKISPSHPVYDLLDEHGFDRTEELYLKRVISLDGKSRAFINDQPVSASLLKQLAGDLVEIHDQFDQLLTPTTHRRVLDQYAQLSEQKQNLSDVFHTYKAAEHALEAARQLLNQHQNQLEFLAHALKEMKEVSPKANEEQDLVSRRQIVAHSQKIKDGVESILKNLRGDKGVQGSLYQSLRVLEKLMTFIPGQVTGVMQTFERASNEITDAELQLENLLSPHESGAQTLEEIDERLYRLRALARKHGCHVDELPQLWEKFAEDYNQIQNGDAGLTKLEQACEQAKQGYLTVANAVSQFRKQAGLELKREVEHELKPLKLERVLFEVQFKELSPQHWTAEGIDEVEFAVQTNPGYPFGGISKIASGGERSRLMLAIKAVLARVNQASIIVFDEIDHAVGGAVAAAIGERLARLGKRQQVLAITHSPQVAACAQAHYVVAKFVQQGETRTAVHQLSNDDRLGEIARMLSADQVTDEARAAAESLLKVSNQ
jgi:DNA repair protein RecN (Recombination protein N)